MSLVASVLAEVCECFQEELKRSKTLLTVDDRASFGLTCRFQDLIKYDSTKEVWANVFPFQKALSQTADIIPERFPLFTLVPHVRPLKKWHKEPAILFEDDFDGSRSCFHRVPPAIRVSSCTLLQGRGLR